MSFRKPDGEPIDLHVLLHGDQDVLFPINHPGLHQVAARRVHGHRGLGGAELKLLIVNQVGGTQRRIRAEPMSFAVTARGSGSLLSLCWAIRSAKRS